MMSLQLSYWEQVAGIAYDEAFPERDHLAEGMGVVFEDCRQIAKNEGVGVKLGRAVIALPSATINLIAKPIFHLAMAFLSLLSTLWSETTTLATAKMYLWCIPRDVQEGIGDLLSLFSDHLGMYWKAEAHWYKELYEEKFSRREVSDAERGQVRKAIGDPEDWGGVSSDEEMRKPLLESDGEDDSF